MFQLTDDLDKWLIILFEKDIPIQLDYYCKSKILTEDWKRKILN